MAGSHGEQTDDAITAFWASETFPMTNSNHFVIELLR